MKGFWSMGRRAIPRNVIHRAGAPMVWVSAVRAKAAEGRRTAMSSVKRDRSDFWFFLIGVFSFFFLSGTGG